MMNSSDKPAEQEDFITEKSTEQPSPNPLAGAATIAVSVPETVEIRLVDASTLADYEVWSLLTSILCSAVVGFVVACIQAKGEAIHGTLVTIVWVTAILTVVCGVTAFMKRRRLTTKTKTIKFRVGDQVIE